MADVIFLNASPFAIAVNLNGSATNAPILAMPAPSTLPLAQTVPGAPYPIQAYKQANIFGASASNEVLDNLLIIFAPDRGPPQIWHLQSTVSVALGLYFYLLDDLVFGVDQTGSSAGITIKKGTNQELQFLLSLIFSVPEAFPTLP